MTDSHAPRLRTVQLRFYEELNDFLPEHRRRKSFTHEFRGTPSVKELLESIGVPHSEIDMILVGDEPVPFSCRIVGGERIAVFPVFERFDISPANRLRPRPLRRTRFVLDVHLRKLARLLRLAGFDCHYQTEQTDLEIIACSRDEKRTILSRDKDLLKHGRVTHGYWVRDTDPPAQFREIIDAFDLRRDFQPFSRCMECNGRLTVADESTVLDHIPFAVLVAYDEFWQCENCRKIYWKGSHYTQLARLIETI